MDEVIISAVAYVIVAMGIISLAWLRKANQGITDYLISRMFRYLIALSGVAIMFAVWIMISAHTMVIDELSNRYMIALFLVIMFLLISGAALAAKRIGDLYGFAVKEE